ncbi:MAG: hypothetical protein HZB92_06085 [Euryarchaeota archaeon]|nr:hypothetical protein [Euryarchaeota archaeon]
MTDSQDKKIIEIPILDQLGIKFDDDTLAFILSAITEGANDPSKIYNPILNFPIILDKLI